MIIGRFEKHDYGFLGSIETLAWRKSGDYGDYLSVKLDCPSLMAPVSAVMALKADQDGFYRLRWNRRTETRGAGRDGAPD